MLRPAVAVIILLNNWGYAATSSYTNSLSTSSSVDQDFVDYSELAKATLANPRQTGNFAVINNRLQFTTSGAWLGVKSYSVPLSFNDSWSAQVDIHLSNFTNMTAGNYLQIGLSLGLGSDFSTAYPNRLIFKATQSLQERRIKFKLYSNNEEISFLSTEKDLEMAEDLTLKIVFNSDTKSISALYKTSPQQGFMFAGEIYLDSSSYFLASGVSPGWLLSAGSTMRLSLFAGSAPDADLTNITDVQDGQMYLRNLLLVGETISYMALVTEWSEDLKNWSQISVTNYVPNLSGSKRSFYRLKISPATLPAPTPPVDPPW